MISKNKFRLCLAVLAVAAALLSCGDFSGETPPEVVIDAEIQDLNQNLCSGTSQLEVTTQITIQETNQFGTRICEYTLTLNNTDPEVPVRAFLYQHNQDGYAHTESSQWMGNMLIEPNKSAEWTGSISLYDDPDADGPLMSLPEKLAGVYNRQDCAQEQQDESFFEQIAVSIAPVCPLE